ncbi:hypothetical protein ACPCIU_06955 [Streptomyces seoulensis]|uniref:hypothetical protein n=1 Tax=Streptomyces seoulensis TaxID=73044 RepID=UPI003C2DCE40
MTKEEWIELQLAKAPEPSAEWVRDMLIRFRFPPEEVEEIYQARLRKEERAAEEKSGNAEE